MPDQRSPAASDVEQPFARPEAQLAAEVVELSALRLLEVVVLVDEVRTGVDEVRIEEHREELVRAVVVVADRPTVAGQRMPFPRQLHRGRTRVGATVCRELKEAPREAESLERRRRPLDEQAIREREDRLEIAFDVEVVVDVGLGERELARRQEHSPERSGMTEHEREPLRLSGLGAPTGAVPEPDAERARPEVAEQLLEQRERHVGRRRRAQALGDHVSTPSPAGAGTRLRRSTTCGSGRPFTFQTRPSRASPRIKKPLVSSCRRLIPWNAMAGNAWWLLCQPSPNESTARTQLFRLRSPVSNGC